MYEHIIVGYDGGEGAQDALTLAQALAPGGRLTLVRAMPYEPFLSEVSIGPPATLVAERKSTREALDRLAGSLGVEAEAVESISPARGLHEAAERLGGDLIAVGSSHRGPVGRVFAGSLARTLLNGSPCAVAVAPHGYREQDRAIARIGVGYDGSAEASDALHAAAELAARRDATVRVIAAIPPLYYAYGGAWVVADPELPAIRREECRHQVDAAVAALPAGLKAEGRVFDGAPATVLVEESEDLDLLFVGSRGYGRLRGVLLGSVSAELIDTVRCPLVAVPRGASVADSATTAGAAGASR
jgi:nucleotide-binding universal stress UspA family protein